MSTWSKRDFRPRWHFTPPFGWINDPNGLVLVDGEYHLFAQYYPYDTVWGPMHWLHAVSSDLLRWRQLGIALRPDELGQIFSGCAVLDEANASGLGGERGPLVAMFTHHGAQEQQSIAFAEDRVHFTKYPGNPVIPNPGCRDFRDPHIVPNPVRGGWSVVVAAGDHVDFYASTDLIHWEKTGEFGRGEDKSGGVFECPDVFPVADPDGTRLWALTCSNVRPEDEGGSRTQYFLGEFDGDIFRQTVPFDRPVLVDEGFDNYAAITFAGAPEPIAMGWATSWVYARQLPTGPFCGQMTLARRVSVRQTAAGPRLAWTPVVPEIVPAPAADGCALPGESFRLRLRAEGRFEAALENGAGERFRFGLDAQGFYTDRTRAGLGDFHPLFAGPLFGHTRAPRLSSGPVEMDLFFDTCLAELFADGGVYACSSLVFPAAPYTRLRLSGAVRAEIGAFA